MANLLQMDERDESDPFVVVGFENARGHFRELGRTEMQVNQAHAFFTTPIYADLDISRKQTLLIKVYDGDQDHPEDRDQPDRRLIGFARMVLSEIVEARNEARSRTAALYTKSNKPAGEVTISAAKVAGGEDRTIVFRVCARSLALSDKVFFRVARVGERNHKVAVFASEAIKREPHPDWAPAKIGSVALCNNKMSTMMDFQVYNQDEHGHAELIGSARASPQELLDGRHGRGLSLGPERGTLFVTDFFYAPHVPNFAELLVNGLELQLSVSVDMTRSNGDPRDRRALHHLERGHQNPYQTCISDIGQALLHYDSDGKIPAFGICAEVRGNHMDAFHLNGAPDPCVEGVDGILAAYEFAVSNVVFSDITVFKPVLDGVVASVKSALRNHPDKDTYHVHLMMTDGDCQDLDSTIERIVSASKYPISFLFVGMGRPDEFRRTREALTAWPLEDSRGNRALRRTVTFVAQNDFGRGETLAFNRAVLERLPRQVEKWKRDFQPRQ